MSHPADHSRSLHQAFTAARKRAGARPFLAESAHCGGRVWSFEEAGREVDDLIDLYARQGWGQGHRVALAVGNHPRHFFHFLALNHLGASIVPLNPDHRGGEIRHAMSLSGAQLVVAIEPRWSELNAALQEDGALAHIAVLDASSCLPHLLASPHCPRTLGSERWPCFLPQALPGHPKAACSPMNT